MSALHVDPGSGFLDPTTPRIDAFDANKKLQLLAAITDLASKGKWPGIHKLCRMLNVAPRTFYQHLELDANFKEAYDEALLALEDHCVENLVRQGNSLNGVTANIFLLKNRWGKRWNENYNVNLHAEPAQLKGILGISEGFIDAEVVKRPELPEKSGDK